MDKSEPTLVPEWLRSSGSVIGGGTSIQSSASSSLRSDDPVSKAARKNLLGTDVHHLGQSSVSDRTTSSYFRQSSSSNGSANVRPSSSFSRNHRDRDWDSDLSVSYNKDKAMLGFSRRRDHSDPLGNKSLYRDDREGLRRSQSMIYDRRGETLHRKVGAESTMSYRKSSNDTNGMKNKGLLHKASFERDFPSLGAEEKLSAFEIGRLPSPGLSLEVHSLPAGASVLMGSDKWTSALAVVPGMIGSNDTGMLPAKAAGPSSSSLSLSVPTGLNMAETVAQGPRVQTAPQSPTEYQRQELAVKQSRQLIPMTPSLPKALVSNPPPDKLKAKIGQPQLLHSPRGGSTKPDLSKTSNMGKLQVLKSVRERNSVPPAVKDGFSPKSGGEVVDFAATGAQLVAGPSTVRSPANSSCPSIAERKLVLPSLEKRPTYQAQSRSDFFNLMRKKSMVNSSSSSDLGPVTTLFDKSGGEGEGVGATSQVTHQHGEDVVSGGLNGVDTPESKDVKAGNGDSCSGLGCLNNKKSNSSYNSNSFSEEEEAAFLRSLGWEENDEEGGLTDEEINAFYKDATKYINSKPSLKILQGMPRFLLALDSQIAGISSGLKSSSSKLES